jgi:hypothetical protein
MQHDAGNTATETSTTIGSTMLDSLESMSEPANTRDQLAVELTAAVIAIQHEQPVVLALRGPTGEQGAMELLPSAPFRPAIHATFEEAVRQRVEEETSLELGFLEQLSSDCSRFSPLSSGARAQRSISIGHLALSRADKGENLGNTEWVGIYSYFPWEDWRSGRPAVLADSLQAEINAWVAQDPGHVVPQHALCRSERVAIAFGSDGGRWDDERVVERLDLLSEAGLAASGVERVMRRDHRRILAAALGRLRAKIRYRPVVFELLPAEFTLFELQKSVEAILGPHLHKQNFRRLVEGTGLVEATGDVRNHTGGRPAKLFRFRREVLLERPAPGVRVRPARAI